MKLLIVMPTLNEQRQLPKPLAQALAIADEVCVSDGGSTDRTVDLARRAGARVVTGPPGRGGQLHRGTTASSCDIFLFLHADTRLPEGARQLIEQAVAGGAIGGGFRVRYDSSRRWLALGSHLINLRTRLTGCPLGDQAQFVTRDAYQAMGGYRDWPILEDLDLIRRLKRHGSTVLANTTVTTSARRFEGLGAARAIAVNWLIWGLYFAGVSPLRLAHLYRNIR